MNNNLTKEEDLLLTQMESMRKWETLSYELSIFVPCAIIISLGAVYDSKIVIWIGLGVYAVIRFSVAFKQCASTPILKSGIQKLRKQCQQIESSTSDTTTT